MLNAQRRSIHELTGKWRHVARAQWFGQDVVILQVERVVSYKAGETEILSQEWFDAAPEDVSGYSVERSQKTEQVVDL